MYSMEARHFMILIKRRMGNIWQCTILRSHLIERGPLEPQFYDLFLKGLRLDDDEILDRSDMNSWPQLREIFTQKFAEKTQREWEDIFDGTDSCVTPIVPLSAKDT